ncbi:MAG: hypothetical protein ACI9NC_004274 [Verrucomicrobiales bacterium]|jgi:hypothetical protein
MVLRASEDGAGSREYKRAEALEVWCEGDLRELIREAAAIPMAKNQKISVQAA